MQSHTINYYAINVWEREYADVPETYPTSIRELRQKMKMLEEAYDITEGLSLEDQYELCRAARLAIAFSETLERELRIKIDNIYSEETVREVTN